MDKATRIIGFTGLIPLLFGSLFKIQHWPGAGILLILSVSWLAIGFMPMYIVHRVLKRKSVVDMLEGILLGVTGMILSLGMLFKVQHWPGGGPMLIVGITLLCFSILFMIINAIMNDQHKSGWNLLGVMFVVSFTFFGWALDWSKNFLDVLSLSDTLVDQVNNAMQESNESLYRANDLPTDYHDNLKRLKGLSEAATLKIEEVENSITNATLGLGPNTSAPPAGSKVWARDNYDIPTYILIGNDPGLPKQEEHSAHWLKMELIEYASEARKLTNSSETEAMIDSLFHFESHALGQYDVPWEVHVFYHAPYASVMHSLATLKLRVIATENRIIHDLTKA